MSQALDLVASATAALAAPAPDLFGCRVERKLVLGPQVAEALQARVAARLERETFVAGRQATLIHSIYFDTPDLALYKRAMEPGPAPGLKLRLRGYGDARGADPALFLEAKLGVTTAEGPRVKQKARLWVSPAKVARLVTPDPGGKPFSRRKAWRPLLGYMAAFEVKPVLTVSYTREAFVSGDMALRVTFDRGYRAARIVAGADGPATPLEPPGDLGEVVIVELKFPAVMPPWLAEALAELGLPAGGQPFSKFRTGVGLVLGPTPGTSP